MFKNVIISILAASFIVACSSTTLGDRISLNLVQITARMNGKYCYTTDNGDKFCMLYRGNKYDKKSKKAIRSSNTNSRSIPANKHSSK